MMKFCSGSGKRGVNGIGIKCPDCNRNWTNLRIGDRVPKHKADKE
jgi:hypothetical protein